MPRRSMLVVLAVIGALTLAALIAARGEEAARDAAVECQSFQFDNGAWKAARSAAKRASESEGERGARTLARNLVRCGRLIGSNPKQVRKLLGRPDSSTTDDNPITHHEYGYIVGYQPDRSSGAEEKLFMEFGPDDRVVYVAAPAADRDGNNMLEKGRPVGGGPRGQ